MRVSIRLSTKGKELANSYARIHSISLSEAFKSALFEKNEEEYDIVLAEKLHKDYLNATTTLPQRQLRKN